MTMTNVTVTQLENATKEITFDTYGFICVDRLMNINGDDTEDENVWVWRNTSGMEITLYDEGNGNCSLVNITKMPETTKVYRNPNPKLVLA